MHRTLHSPVSFELAVHLDPAEDEEEGNGCGEDDEAVGEEVEGGRGGPAHPGLGGPLHTDSGHHYFFNSKSQ